MRLDLPEPDTPVTHVMRPMGISTLTSRRLWALAPTKRMARPSFFLRLEGMGIRFSPERYGPVTDVGDAMMAEGVPSATMLPPRAPAPGPMSTTWSADRMA